MNWKRLLASDLDGTLIPPGGVDARVTHFAERLAALPDCALAYVTGRHLSLAQEGVEESGLPSPDFLACDVGTSIYRQEKGQWRPLEGYRERMRELLRLDSADQIRNLLAGPPELKLQEDERQAEFKASFYLDPGEPGQAALRRAEGVLRDHGLRANMIFSVDTSSDQGLLDVLPLGASKESAVSFLAEELGIVLEQVLFAGDSGNDLEALLSASLGVLVGNAPEGLRHQLREELRRTGRSVTVHFARAHYAAGVIEAMDAFGWIAQTGDEE